MKYRIIIIGTLLALDAALTATLPHDSVAAVGTAIIITIATAVSCRAALRAL